MSNSSALHKVTRLRREKHNTIRNAPLDVFSVYGKHGATSEKIAAEPCMSKPHVLCNFSGKGAIYTEVLGGAPFGPERMRRSDLAAVKDVVLG